MSTIQSTQSQLPSSPILIESTNTVNVSGAYHSSHKTTSSGEINEVVPPKDNECFSIDGQIPPSTETVSTSNEGQNNPRSSSERFPPWTQRKASPPVCEIEMCDFNLLASTVENIEHVTCEQPPKLIAIKSHNRTQKTRQLTTTRSSARIRTRRELENASTSVPPQKKRKRDEDNISLATPHENSLASSRTQKTQSEASRFVIRIPGRTPPSDTKIDHTAELQMYPNRKFPTKKIPMDGDFNMSKSEHFTAFPPRFRRVLALYATQRIAPQVTSEPTILQSSMGSQHAQAPRRSLRRAAHKPTPVATR